ncbi:MAG: FAD-dependent oxidoreductase [Endomicrobiaceae bacterium]|nr:FAD-dependent oxidoreductase [Endomicrobiaceae bacterium]
MKVLIVGGGAAGASCAARLRRVLEHAEITILEKTSEVSIANCGLPYYCSDVISDRNNILVSNPETFKNLFNIDVKLNCEIIEIDSENKKVKTITGERLSYDKLVLALGASPVIPNIEGINNNKIFTVRTLEDADKIKEFIKKNNVKNAVVIGGGFIGVEMAENFAHINLNTSLVELSNQILAPIDLDVVAFAQNQMRENGVNLYLQDGVKRFEQENIVLNSDKKIPYDIAVLSIGVKPETKIAKDCGLQLGLHDSIKVNEFMQTSNPDIYAAGDSIEVTDFITDSQTLIPLAGPANRQGRIIADNIAGTKSGYKKTQGTAVVKVFDLTVASVGNNEKQLQKKNISYKKVHIWGNSHAGYYPNSFPLLIKILFDEKGKIFGAQAAGLEGVEKRIDVISSVIRLNGKISDLLNSELCYAPPYSSAKDPVNIVAMAAENILNNLVKPVFYEDLKDSYIIDVRPKISFDLKSIPNAVNIPAQELRERLSEIPKDKKVVLYCAKGFTSYIASRILTQSGFNNIYSLSGGIMLYEEIIKDKQGVLNMNNKKTNIPITCTVIKLDACGMQCPGPIMKLSETIKNIQEGQSVELSTTDAGFKSDIEGWCQITGNTLLNLTTENKIIKAIICKGKGNSPSFSNNIVNNSSGQTIVVFSNDLDKVIASMIIANGAVASGKKVTMFFTFWGLNVLRKSILNKKVKKNIIEKMFSMMMPKGINKLKLSKMNMLGFGTLMMKMVMKSKNVSTLQQLIDDAQKNGVKFIACNMSMDVMGVKQEELIDGVEIGGVAKYIAESNNANSNLFI